MLGTETKDDVGVLEDPPVVVGADSCSIVVVGVVTAEDAVDCDDAACDWLDRLSRRAANRDQHKVAWPLDGSVHRLTVQDG